MKSTFKLIAMLIACLMLTMSFVACSEKPAAPAADADSDLAYIEGNGKLVIGITEYKPMNYYDENGVQHVVWFEDARSIAAKMGLVKTLGLKGVSIWNISSFFKPMYTVMQSMFDIEKL